MSTQATEPDPMPSDAAQAAHRAFHEAWGGPSESLNLYVDSPIWERVAEAVAERAWDEGAKKRAQPVAATPGRAHLLSSCWCGQRHTREDFL